MEEKETVENVGKGKKNLEYIMSSDKLKFFVCKNDVVLYISVSDKERLE